MDVENAEDVAYMCGSERIIRVISKETEAYLLEEASFAPTITTVERDALVRQRADAAAHYAAYVRQRAELLAEVKERLAALRAATDAATRTLAVALIKARNVQELRALATPEGEGAASTAVSDMLLHHAEYPTLTHSDRLWLEIMFLGRRRSRRGCVCG